MVRGVSHRIVVFGLVCICSMLGLVHGQEITGEQLDKFLGSRDARIMYSWQIRTLLEAQSAHRPVAQAYAYIFLQAPDLAADLIEGGPGALAGRVTKDAIFAAAKTIVGHPEKACMEMANTLYDKGLEDYRANYKLYKEYKENGALSKEDRQAFIARGDPLEKVLLGKELFADTLAYKYNAGEWEGVRDRVLSKVAELEGVSSQWDALTTLKEVKEVLAEAKAGLDAYPPYQKHLERMHEMTAAEPPSQSPRAGDQGGRGSLQPLLAGSADVNARHSHGTPGGRAATDTVLSLAEWKRLLEGGKWQRVVEEHPWGLEFASGSVIEWEGGRIQRTAPYELRKEGAKILLVINDKGKDVFAEVERITDDSIRIGEMNATAPADVGDKEWIVLKRVRPESKDRGKQIIYDKWPFDTAEAKRRQKEATEALGVPVEKAIDLGGGVKLELVLIPAGEFDMGSPDSEEGREGDEGPVHRVRITKPFYMGKYEVTQGQYEQVMGNNPSYFKGTRNPVETVTWDEAVDFCRKASQITGRKVRLPTEAEWEYACRAGSTGKYCYGDEEGRLGDYAWHAGNAGVQTHPVGQKKPNAWGVYDMHGNVFEWCAACVIRGGSYDPFFSCRSAARFVPAPDRHGENVGFRVVVDLEGMGADAEPLSPPAPVSVPPVFSTPGNTIDLGGGVKLELVQIKPGKFNMGSNDGGTNEKPAHEVEITKGFSMGKYEVTQGQYERVMGSNPSSFKGTDRPVENMTWDEAVEFCRKASQITGRKVRLPTEAEWEYACRAGSTGKYCYGDDDGRLEEYAWYGANSGGETHPVGQKKPNAWGLYDMHGNVWEWCADWYGAYTGTRAVDPKGPGTGEARILRGAALYTLPMHCRAANRIWDPPGARTRNRGFRVVVDFQ